jgi:hypothetical protein
MARPFRTPSNDCSPKWYNSESKTGAPRHHTRVQYSSITQKAKEVILAVAKLRFVLVPRAHRSEG